MKNITTNEMNLLNEIKNYTENYFSSSEPMWMHIKSMQSDMKKNRGLISSLIQKEIVKLDNTESIIEIKKDYWLENNNSGTSFINLSISN